MSSEEQKTLYLLINFAEKLVSNKTYVSMKDVGANYKKTNLKTLNKQNKQLIDVSWKLGQKFWENETLQIIRDYLLHDALAMRINNRITTVMPYIKLHTNTPKKGIIYIFAYYYPETKKFLWFGDLHNYLKTVEVSDEIINSEGFKNIPEYMADRMAVYVRNMIYIHDIKIKNLKTINLIKVDYSFKNKSNTCRAYIIADLGYKTILDKI